MFLLLIDQHWLNYLFEVYQSNGDVFYDYPYTTQPDYSKLDYSRQEYRDQEATSQNNDDFTNFNPSEFIG